MLHIQRYQVREHAGPEEPESVQAFATIQEASFASALHEQLEFELGRAPSQAKTRQPSWEPLQEIDPGV
jgi:hypothetical protein